MTEEIDLSASFKAYDVRGIVGETITAEAVEAIGAAFADVLKLSGQTVLVGGDMRPSSPEFAAAFARGAAYRGANPVMLGLISTDELYYACGSMEAAGVVFTASHNPAAYNGIKMAQAGAVPVSSDTGLYEIRDLAQIYLDEGLPVSGDGPQGETTALDVLEGYARYLRSLVDLSGIRPLKVVVDAGNGMAGLTTPAVLGDQLLQGLPLDIVEVYFELDGTFPNHPANPLEPENLRDLQEAVIEHGADIGLAFDGDADRCFVIDELGNPVSPSAITALVARREIARAKALGEQTPVIIHNLITSRAVPELVEHDGGRAVVTRVGHSFIKAVMAKEGAVFGGEHSAHYYFRDFYNADTGMLAAMHVLAALGEQDTALSALAEEYEPYVSSGEINSTVEDKTGAVAAVLEEFANGHGDNAEGTGVVCDACHRDLAGRGTVVSTMDGTTVCAADGSFWFNLRPSNTEPFLRFNGEAIDSKTMELVRDGVLEIVRRNA
ncbi:phosphomannomutase/phosphoglucomutase [Paeniglutamicibacter cryotolerans]|uniref:Phosphomannomutase n=1 Tax=Paeniglutamicibacter cryotolerans TaxID=670079 RepID=A0A839QL65_9MICC|nr:phosphomannomutase/phosphoglucomutase [Paeniglutamicibacter cryotolerans]MBB2995325.1 phosphomannomutase [Paeniglutamicibacter cryotolerans]